MQLYIGENIKCLRRQKGITQETLADYMHVSTAAVSKWERNETLPDISMVIPLASYFGVSTDEILGLDNVKNEEKISEYLEESSRLAALGRVHEKFNLITSAYSEFPNDWRIIDAYMWELNYDPNCREPYGYEVHKEELYRLCQRVLDECPVDKTRYTALSIIGGLYTLDNNRQKAIETAGRFPDYWLTMGEELEGCFMESSDQWLAQIRENIWDITSLLYVKIRNTALYAPNIDAHTRIKYLNCSVSLIKMIFDNGDYGFFNYDLSCLYLHIANQYTISDDLDKAFEHYEAAFKYAKDFDNLPKKTIHSSFLVKGKALDMAKTNSNYEGNLVSLQMELLCSGDIFPKIKETLQIQEIIKKYEPHIGNKKVYS